MLDKYWMRTRASYTNTDNAQGVNTLTYTQPTDKFRRWNYIWVILFSRCTSSFRKVNFDFIFAHAIFLTTFQHATEYITIFSLSCVHHHRSFVSFALLLLFEIGSVVALCLSMWVFCFLPALPLLTWMMVISNLNRLTSVTNFNKLFKWTRFDKFFSR